MSGPWDDYKQSASAVASGPWDAYKTTQSAPQPQGEQELNSWMGKYKDSEIGPIERTLRHPFDQGLPGQPMQSGDDNSPWYSKLNDMIKAGIHTGLTIPAGVIDTAIHPATILTGHGDATPMSNLVNNLLPQTPQQQTYAGNIGNVFNAIDPQMLLPSSHPTSPKGMVPAELRSVPKGGLEDLPTEIIPPKEEGPWTQYKSQDELPLTNSIEDIAQARNARANQADMFDNNQGTPATPYPAEDMLPPKQVGDQGELPLANSVEQAAAMQGERENQMDLFNDQARGDAVPYDAKSIMDAQNAREQDALRRSTQDISYENIPPDGVIPRDSLRMANGEPMLRVPRGNEWAVDENGIPVRQGIPESTVAPDYVNKYMRQDEGARNDLGNAIQEANGPKLGPDENYGAGSLDLPETVSPQFNAVVGNLRRGRIGSQRGGINSDILEPLARATKDLLNKGISMFETGARVPIQRIVGMLPEHQMRSLPGMRDSLKGIILDPKPGEAILKDALAQGPIPGKLFKNLQSGMSLAGEKLGSVALKGAAQWLQAASSKTAFRVRTVVKPVEKTLYDLPRKEFQQLKEVMKNEMMSRQRLSPETLARTLSPKQLTAYNKMRDAFDGAFEQTNATRKAAGDPPITRTEAYAASQRHGDYGLPIFTKDGKLVWHVQSSTMAQAKRALAYMQKTLGDKIDTEKSTISYKPDTSGVGVPKDIQNGYQQMLRFLDKNDPAATLISDSIAKYQEAHGGKILNQHERFMDKHYIRGFEGDKPWMTESENSNHFFKAQVSYLKNSYAWNHMQEAINNIKPLLTSQELTKSQPGVVDLIQAHMNRETGVSGNVAAQIESALAKMIPSVSISRQGIYAGMGVSRSSLYHLTSDVKSATYLQQLGASPGYMLATPLQGLLAVANHRLLSGQGQAHGAINTLMRTVSDSMVALAEHQLHGMSGMDVKLPGMSEIGRRALVYAENNNVIHKTILDEYQSLGAHGPAEAVTRALSPSITTPEKAGRLTVFMSFAHHLIDSGLPEKLAFQKAAEFTNHSLTSMERQDRPLVVGKLGVIGEAGYQYKSYLFNEYNQLSNIARDAIRRRDPTPMLAHIGALMFLGGALALPGVQEISDTWDRFKDSVASLKPEWYKKISNVISPLGIKGGLVNGSDDFATASAVSGPLSQMTGVSLGNRFNTAILDVKHPLAQFAAVPQELLEWSQLGKLGINPTKRNAEQALWANAPPLMRGQMETRLSDFQNGKNPDGTTSVRKASNINDVSTDYKRTEHDTNVRAWGVKSVEEQKARDIRYANNEEQGRVMIASKNLLSKMVTHAMDGDTEGARDYGRKAMELIPDQGMIEDALNQAIMDKAATPEERDRMKAASMATMVKLLRVKK